MDSPSPSAPYSPPVGAPPGGGAKRGGAKAGFSIIVMVATCVVFTLAGMVVAGMVIVSKSQPKPVVSYSEVWLDNRSAERLTIEVDSKVEGTLAPKDEPGDILVLRLADGNRLVRILDASGAEKASTSLELHAVRLIYPVGEATEYAAVVVHYARPGTKAPSDSAKLLARGADGITWKMPVSIPVARGLDEDFPDKNPGPAVRHLCRVKGSQAGCYGGPRTLTSLTTYSGQGADE